MTEIALATRIDDFFRDAVESAIKARQVEASGSTTTYLVTLLEDQARPAVGESKAADKPYTLLLEDALETPDLGERFERLRLVGDEVLYRLGFFGDHFEARGVDPEYLIRLGSRAYGAAGSLITGGSSRSLDSAAAEPSGIDVFGELAKKFGSFVGVLNEVADLTVAAGAVTSRAVVKLYERWLRTRSDSLADALSSHGFVAPSRGAKGVLQ